MTFLLITSSQLWTLRLVLTLLERKTGKKFILIKKGVFVVVFVACGYVCVCGEGVLQTDTIRYTDSSYISTICICMIKTYGSGNETDLTFTEFC